MYVKMNHRMAILNVFKNINRRAQKKGGGVSSVVCDHFGQGFHIRKFCNYFEVYIQYYVLSDSVIKISLLSFMILKITSNYFSLPF